MRSRRAPGAGEVDETPGLSTTSLPWSAMRECLTGRTHPRRTGYGGDGRFEVCQVDPFASRGRPALAVGSTGTAAGGSRAGRGRAQVLEFGAQFGNTFAGGVGLRVCGGGVGAGDLGAVAFGCRRGAGGGEFGVEPPGVFGCRGHRGVLLGDRSGQPLAVLVELPGEQLDPVLEADDLLSMGRCGLIELLLPAVLCRGVLSPGCGELGAGLGGLGVGGRGGGIGVGAFGASGVEFVPQCRDLGCGVGPDLVGLGLHAPQLGIDRRRIGEQIGRSEFLRLTGDLRAVHTAPGHVLAERKVSLRNGSEVSAERLATAL